MLFKYSLYRSILKRFYALESENIMEVIKGKKLINCVGETVSVSKALTNKTVVLFYFSASWCSPCKELLPKIKKVYTIAKKRRFGLEIIYISSDTDEDIFNKYYKTKHGGWYAIGFGDPLAEELRQIYAVTAIPVIFVVNISDGKLISRNGRAEIENVGENVLVQWFP